MSSSNMSFPMTKKPFAPLILLWELGTGSITYSEKELVCPFLEVYHSCNVSLQCGCDKTFVLNATLVSRLLSSGTISIYINHSCIGGLSRHGNLKKQRSKKTKIYHFLCGIIFLRHPCRPDEFFLWRYTDIRKCAVATGPFS